MREVDTFAAAYVAVSGVLLDYGCMVAPYLLGGEWDALKDCCDAARRSPPATPEDRAKIERQIDDLLTNCVYHPRAASL